MSDLYLSYRSGSDRRWLPVYGEERSRYVEKWQIWKKRWLRVEHILYESLLFSNPMVFSSIISPDPHLYFSCSVFFSLFSFSSFPSICLSFLLLPHFPHSFLSISYLLLLVLGQAFLIMTFLLRRSWDTLRQRWERISVEFNLDLCFTLRQWHSSPSYRWVKYCPVPWSDRREVWQGVLSVNQFLLIGLCLLSSRSILFCCQWCWD